MEIVLEAKVMKKHFFLRKIVYSLPYIGRYPEEEFHRKRLGFRDR